MKQNKLKQNKIYIYGKHAVMEALVNTPHVLDKVFLSNENRDPELIKALKKANVSVSSMGSKETKKIGENTKHQGIIGLVILNRLMQSYEEFIKKLKITPDTALLILGEIQDPQNVGAIIRSAAAFGISGVLLPKYNQAPVTGAVVKVSAGMAFRIPLVEIGNVNSTVKDLKEKGFWIYGLDGESKENISKEKYESPTVFVLGNESKGIREKTKEVADKLISISTHPKCESLNVAASLAVVLYDWSYKHPNSVN